MPQMHVAAYHAEAGYRGDVPGLGVLCIKENHILAAGAYSNSIGKQSTYATVGHYFTKHLAIVGGLVDGYTFNDGKPFPMLAGVVSLPITQHVKAHVLLIPPVANISPATAQISFSWSLK